MATTLEHTVPAYVSKTGLSFLATFFHWSRAQEYNRLLWVGISLAVHGCIITPITLLILLSSGTDVAMVPFTLAMLSMVSVVIVNLAALPTRITIPVLFLSVLIDIAVIVTALI